MTDFDFDVWFILDTLQGASIILQSEETELADEYAEKLLNMAKRAMRIHTLSKDGAELPEILYDEIAELKEFALDLEIMLLNQHSQ